MPHIKIGRPVGHPSITDLRTLSKLPFRTVMIPRSLSRRSSTWPVGSIWNARSRVVPQSMPIRAGRAVFMSWPQSKLQGLQNGFHSRRATVEFTVVENQGSPLLRVQSFLAMPSVSLDLYAELLGVRPDR